MTRVHIRWERRPALPAADRLRRLLSEAVARTGASDAEVHLVITSDDRIHELNRRFRDVDRPTDVLSFPDGDQLPSGRVLLGEIVISLDSARRQAGDFGHDEVRELLELALHGLLHLIGYDHERDRGQMNELEIQLREELLS